MEFLKTKEQILLKLNDYSDPKEKGISDWSPSFRGLDVRYSCGSGRKFRLHTADEIYTFFKDDPRGKVTGAQYSSSSQWSQIDGPSYLISYRGWDLPDWYCYCFVRSPGQSDYCNLLKIYYRGWSISRDYMDRELSLEKSHHHVYNFNQRIKFTHTLWKVSHRESGEQWKPRIETLWSCKYETACELCDGERIEDDRDFMGKVRRHNRDFFRAERVKKAIKYTREKIIWLLTIIVFYSFLASAIYLVLKLF